MPCRVGTAQMYDLLDKITDGEAHRRTTWRCWRSCATWCKSTSLCGLGQTAPNPVLSTLRYFRQEYDAAAEARADGNGQPARTPNARRWQMNGHAQQTASSR